MTHERYPHIAQVRPKCRIPVPARSSDVIPMARNAARNEQGSVCVLSADFGGDWVQVDGRVEVVEQPEAIEALAGYYRSISGEHPDWDEYRQAMADQGKVLLRLAIGRWGPVSRGGFPARLLAHGGAHG